MGRGDGGDKAHWPDAILPYSHRFEAFGHCVNQEAAIACMQKSNISIHGGACNDSRHLLSPADGSGGATQAAIFTCRKSAWYIFLCYMIYTDALITLSWNLCLYISSGSTRHIHIGFPEFSSDMGYVIGYYLLLSTSKVLQDLWTDSYIQMRTYGVYNTLSAMLRWSVDGKLWIIAYDASSSTQSLISSRI